MQSPRPALSGPRHVFLHVLGVLIGWGIFGWSWWTVLFGQPFHPAVLAKLIALTLILAPLLTFWWVHHNRDIYARKGQRRGVRSAPEIYHEDWTGRLVHAEFNALRDSPLVVINSTTEDKFFLASPNSLSIRKDS